MYSFDSFRPEHISSLRVEDTTLLAPVTSYPKIIEVYAEHPSFTLFYNGRFLFCGGAVIPWKGFGEVWMLVGDESLAPHAWAALKYSRLAAKIIHQHFGVERLQTPVCVDYPKWKRFAEACGFKSEGLMKHYGPDGNDYFMMSRTEWDR